jgi:hypothetical protein
MNSERTVGFWFLIIIGIFILIMLLMGQTMSLINYEFTVSIGLQEPADIVGEMGVALNKGFGVGDTIIYIPLLLAGLSGLWFRKEWGIFIMASAMGITVYWPMVCLFFLLFARGTQGFNFTDFTSYGIILSFFSIYGLWGLWYLCKNRNTLVQK